MKIMEWTPRKGKRTKGRPSTRWRNEIVKEWVLTWEREAEDRKKWTGRVETCAQKWARGTELVLIRIKK